MPPYELIALYIMSAYSFEVDVAEVCFGQVYFVFHRIAKVDKVAQQRDEGAVRCAVCMRV